MSDLQMTVVDYFEKADGKISKTCFFTVGCSLLVIFVPDIQPPYHPNVICVQGVSKKSVHFCLL